MNGVNRHWRNGYRRININDIYHVEEQLQAYDSHLYVMWREEDNTWMIMDGLVDLAIMKIPQVGFETLDSRVVTHLRKIHAISGFNASHELQESEDKRQRDFDKAQEDMSYNFAQDIRSTVKQL